ncbi:MAG: hypothetical protein LBU18_01610 [Treponema sp.]|nr:hypothetical protein [Treponema sp.]
MDYNVEIVYLFYNEYLYFFGYLLKDINQNDIMTIYSSLINKYKELYGTAYHLDKIVDGLSKTESPYKAIWNYNGIRIDIHITYQVTNKWGISIDYLVKPEKAELLYKK